jgi:hypothetical protein
MLTTTSVPMAVPMAVIAIAQVAIFSRGAQFYFFLMMNLLLWSVGVTYVTMMIVRMIVVMMRLGFL